MHDALLAEIVKTCRVYFQQSEESKKDIPYPNLGQETLMGAIVQQADAIERAYQMLEMNGVPRERARSVANGIEVLTTRFRKADFAHSAEVPRKP